MADRRWWGDWIQQNISTMKAKSAKAVEFLTHDLAEFTEVIQHDTVTAIAATALAFKEKLNVEEHTEEDQAFSKGLSSLLGAISEVFTPTVRLCNLQANPATYSSTADDQYNIWLLTFSLECQKRAISDLLVNSPRIRDLYSKLVPSEVTHADFWCRYFYRVHQLHQEEARRRALKERAEQSTHSEDLKWEDDEDELEGTTSTPNNLNKVTNNWHSRTHEQPGYKVQETGLGVTVTSLSENVSNEMQPLALLSVEDNKGIQYKSTAGETTQMLESLLEIEKHENKSVLKEELCYKLFADEGTRIGENTPGSEEYSVSTLELRHHDSIHLQPDIAQNATVESNTNIDEPAFMGRNGNTSNYVENWDEDLDLDMTEEEIQMTLSRAEASGELVPEEWDDWACDQN
ncbi:BSD domain-containing protein 1-like isoform X2 [Scyliorhinus canicula]|uniref:BSD domain-containing protein 1-like isoform X2 n=1 Tax=Scyliorhinus canicula TaxID=7830 RepID=UPI0018F70CCF|nr:BSD domain-containing protein 1-like isoform X2 [Scyliorhinus canicula]